MDHASRKIPLNISNLKPGGCWGFLVEMLTHPEMPDGIEDASDLACSVSENTRGMTYSSSNRGSSERHFSFRYHLRGEGCDQLRHNRHFTGMVHNFGHSFFEAFCFLNQYLHSLFLNVISLRASGYQKFIRIDDD